VYSFVSIVPVCDENIYCLQVIELPVKHPELFDALGIAQPKGK
jgi:ATP-dependent 26S proteasome regulatory subunit